MTRFDFAKAVPETPRAFSEAMRGAIEKIDRPNARPTKPRALLVAALVGALLLAVTAFALTRGFGVLDFWARNRRNPMPPETAGLVRSLDDIAQAETARVRYRALDAAATDGRFAMTVVAELKEPGKYMLMDDAGWGDPLAIPDDSGKSYAERAQETGQTLLCIAPSLTINGEELGYGVRSRLEGDALYLYADVAYKQASGATVSVDLSIADYEIYGATQTAHAVTIDAGASETAHIAFEIEIQSQILESRAFEGNWATGSITVERVRVERTPFDTRVMVTYLAPEGTAPDAVPVSFFFTSDAAGETPYAGYDNKARTTYIGANRFETVRFWEAMARLPDTIWLRPFFWDTNAWGDTLAFTTNDGRTDA